MKLKEFSILLILLLVISNCYAQSLEELEGGEDQQSDVATAQLIGRLSILEEKINNTASKGDIESLAYLLAGYMDQKVNDLIITFIVAQGGVALAVLGYLLYLKSRRRI